MVNDYISILTLFVKPPVIFAFPIIIYTIYFWYRSVKS